MQANMQMEGANNGESEHASCSDDGQFLVAFRKIMKKEIEVMVIHTVHQVIRPVVEELIRKVVREESGFYLFGSRLHEQELLNLNIGLLFAGGGSTSKVKEEIQSAEEKFMNCATRNNANERPMAKERSLQLKFLDEIDGPVLTGTAIIGKGGTPVRVALVDKTTGHFVNCGPESSAKVEIVFLDASDDDNVQNLSVEDFNRRIIREGDKKKPHFAKSHYVYLDNGVGMLCNAKLGHDSKWMKSCMCRLGASIVGNFGGIEVQEGSTESFMVSDSRSNLYGNHYPPCLSDHVWRLENIGKDGPRCKSLNVEKVFTVQDFLFLLSIDPRRLQKILRTGAVWKTTVDHARTCVIDDKRVYLYYPSSETNMVVTFDVVGRMKGLIHDSHYIPVNDLSADEKECAHKLLLSAFENRNDITYFQCETSLLLQFPYRSSDNNAATNSFAQEGSDDSDLIIAENRNGRDVVVNPFHESTSARQIYDDPYNIVPNQMLTPEFSDNIHALLEHFGDNETLMSVCFPESNNESHSHEQSNAGNINLVEVVAVMLCVHRARKRFMALGGIQVHKRPRI